MADDIPALVADLSSKDDVIRKSALDRLMALTETSVNWIYDHLEPLCGKFESDNSYQRSIGAMLIANLAKSDTQGRLERVVSRFVDQMNDEKFITARITLQHAWRFGTANAIYAKVISEGLNTSLTTNPHLATHGNLIRLDAVTSLREILRVYPDAVNIEAVHAAITESCDAKEATKLTAMLQAGRG